MTEWTYGREVDPTESQSPSWLDYGRSVLSGWNQLEAQAHAAGRWLAEKTGDQLAEDYHKASQELAHLDSEAQVS